MSSCALANSEPSCNLSASFFHAAFAAICSGFKDLAFFPRPTSIILLPTRSLAPFSRSAPKCLISETLSKKSAKNSGSFLSTACLTATSRILYSPVGVLALRLSTPSCKAASVRFFSNASASELIGDLATSLLTDLFNMPHPNPGFLATCGASFLSAIILLRRRCASGICAALEATISSVCLSSTPLITSVAASANALALTSVAPAFRSLFANW